jgi:hypothetical protein
VLYKKFIRLQVIVNRSRADLEDVIAVVDELFPATDYVVNQYSPGLAEFTIEFTDVVDEINPEIHALIRFLRGLRGSGVRAIVLWPNENVMNQNEPFSFGPSADVEGFSNGFPLVGLGGGKLIRGDSA